MNSGGPRKERMSTTSPLILGKFLQVAMPCPVPARGRRERAQERKQGSKEHLWHLQSSLFIQRCFNPLILRKFPHNSVFPAWLCHGEKLWKSNLWKLWSMVRNLSHIFSRESQDLLLKAFPSMWEKFPVKKSGCSSSHLYLFWADPKACPSPRGPFSRYILYRV